MAERRMFSKTILMSDEFLDMPQSARLLYYDLALRADDDGFVNSPRSIMRQIGASDDDIKLLIAKRFVLIFDSGVIVIKHWRMANALRKDRYTPTAFQEELAMLRIKENGSYTKRLPDGCQVVASCLPQEREEENSIDKISLDQERIGEERGTGETHSVLPDKWTEEYKESIRERARRAFHGE